MPARHTWECRGCGWRIEDHLGTSPPPHPTQVIRDVPGFGRVPVEIWCEDPVFEILWTTGKGGDYGLSLLDSGGRSFEFEYDLFSPKHGQKVQIKSMEDARRVQRECERMAADGVHRPVVFRSFEQNKSNMNKNVFGERPPEAMKRPVTRSKAGVPFIKRVNRSNPPEK